MSCSAWRGHGCRTVNTKRQAMRTAMAAGAAATPEGHVALAGCKGTGEVHEAPVKGHPLRLASESISKGEKGQGQENAC